MNLKIERWLITKINHSNPNYLSLIYYNTTLLLYFTFFTTFYYFIQKHICFRAQRDLGVLLLTSYLCLLANLNHRSRVKILRI